MAPDQLPDPMAVALSVAAVFERLGIPYFAGGSLASSLHGEPRSTVDVDFVADLRPTHVNPLVSELRGEYYVSDVAVRGDSLDQARLDTWAERLGVADLLAQAKREAEQR